MQSKMCESQNWFRGLWDSRTKSLVFQRSRELWREGVKSRRPMCLNQEEKKGAEKVDISFWQEGREAMSGMPGVT